MSVVLCVSAIAAVLGGGFRLAVVALALRGTTPGEQPAILRALAATDEPGRIAAGSE